MRVALVNPAPAGGDRGGALLARLQKPAIQAVLRLVEDDAERVPPLCLLAIAAELPADWQMELIDEPQCLPAERDWLAEDWDLVFVTAMINQVGRARAIARRCRQRGIPTVVGGFHASACPEEMGTDFDTVIVGEGEGPLRQFLADRLAGCPRPIYRSRGDLDLGTLKTPRYELLRNHERYTMFPLLASRGCPHDCSFCSVTRLYGHRLRCRPVDAILADIRAIRQLVPRPFLSFSDENLLADRHFAARLLEALVAERIRFECHTDLTVARDARLLDLLVRAGCRRLQIGFESNNPVSLAQIGPFKRRMAETALTDLQAIQSRGIRVMGMFLVGLDGDTPERLAELADFVLAAGFHQVDFSILTPIPGTRIYEQLEAEGRILTKDWDRYTWQEVVYRPKQISARQLKDWINTTLARFYAPAEQRKRRAFFKKLLGKSRSGV